MKFIAIDQEGYFVSQGIRWNDANICRPLLQNMRQSNNGAWVTSEVKDETNDFYFVEAFDQPYFALRVEKAEDFFWTIQMPYECKATFDVRQLAADEWDRFLGHTTEGVAFVFSRAAQDQFFKQIEDFDDDSFTVHGARIVPQSWPSYSSKELTVSDWDKSYAEERTGWDLGAAHPALQSISAQINLSKSRVLVLGCGAGHDAAYLARQGHFVTAVDFSEEALKKARSLYGNISNLTFVKADALKLPPKMNASFDLIFEHTCYLALLPEKRNALVKTWRQVLTDQGQLLAILPLFDKIGGPPFSSTEWEIRQRLKKDFHFLFWSRSKVTHPSRIAKELIVFAKRV